MVINLIEDLEKLKNKTLLTKNRREMKIDNIVFCKSKIIIVCLDSAGDDFLFYVKGCRIISENGNDHIVGIK